LELEPKGKGPGGSITCEQINGRRHFKFPVGVFDIDQQVFVPANTVIEGSANPNDPSDKKKKPDVTTQTFFVATRGVANAEIAYCGTNNNLPPAGPGSAQQLRIGFLLNSNTKVKHINFQGRDTIRPNDNGNLCGGAVFETPGCVSPGFSGPGQSWATRGMPLACYDAPGVQNGLLTGDGRGVNNVVIERVRLNDLFLPSDPSQHQFSTGSGSQLAVWVAATPDGSPTTGIHVKNLVSMLTRGDGINLHGNVQRAIVEDCYIANTGDDNYALWGANGSPAGIVFRNNVAVNPGVTRNYGYGVCVAVYGAKDVTITGTKCYDLDEEKWNKQPFSNSCLAYVHDGWFGAIYPQGNTINIHDNHYLYMNKTNKEIPDSPGRPAVRRDPGAAMAVGWR
jgi:hypothetical protein